MCLHPAELTLKKSFVVETRDGLRVINLQEVQHVFRFQHEVGNADCDNSDRRNVTVKKLHVINRCLVVSGEKNQNCRGYNKFPALFHFEA